MPVEWTGSIVVPIFKGTGNIRKFSCYRAVKHHENGNEGGGKDFRRKAL